MKTRKLLIIILAIVLLAVYYVLGTDYLKQRREHAALASQIAETTQALAQVPTPPADLESRLADAQAGLDTVNNSMPAQLNTTQIINTILRLAEEIGVKAIPLGTQPWAMENINGENYTVFRLNVVVRGTFAELSSFLDRLENGELETLVMEYVSVDITTGPSRGEDSRGSSLPVDARLEIAVYSRPPATDTEEKG